MCPTGVGSVDTTLLIAAHTAGDTSQSTLRNFCRERSFFFSIGSFFSDGWRETLCKEKDNMNSEEQEKYLWACEPGEDLPQNNLQQKLDHTKIAIYRRTTNGCNSWSGEREGVGRREGKGREGRPDAE